MNNKEILDLIQTVMDEEPEFPGEIPDDMYQAIVSGDKDTVAETLRIAVRLTKQGIMQRVRDRLV